MSNGYIRDTDFISSEMFQYVDSIAVKQKIDRWFYAPITNTLVYRNSKTKKWYSESVDRRINEGYTY